MTRVRPAELGQRFDMTWQNVKLVTAGKKNTASCHVRLKGNREVTTVVKRDSRIKERNSLPDTVKQENVKPVSR